MYKIVIKRALDIICAMLALIVFCWLYAIIAVLVKIKLGNPVLFTQERPGMIDKKTGKERIFRLYKFRTMKDAYDENGNPLPDEERLTSFGKKLRAWSLDELPEAINILTGDMSVVGPRPLLVRYLDRYNEHQRRRHEVRPGLSGWAQVHGRNTVSWEDKFDMDVWYVDHVSFFLDVKIIVQSVIVALKHDGINSETSATMEEFMGSKDEF